MFVRFERVQRPQSFNDNPITSLSWMSNDDHNNNCNNQNDAEQQQQQQQQQQQDSDNHQQHLNHHYHHHQQQQAQLFNEDSTLSRDINNNNNAHQQHCEINTRSNKCVNNQQQEEQSDHLESLDGWLAVGNCRGVVGVTYTTIDSQQLIINRDAWNDNDNDNSKRYQSINDDQSSTDNNANDIFHLQYNNYRQSQYYRSMVTTPIRTIPARTNFNLRGHRSEIVFVRWNEPFQKLASCDRNGVIFVWIKYEGRWSIELINDRSTRVTDFAWSHDGRMALICYMDGFVLVGSVSGQRYWSSMLNLNECSITCGTWTPNNQNVLFGTSNGHILVISVHGVFITQISVQEGIEIIGLQWSCRKFMKKPKRNNRQQQQQQSDQSPLGSDSLSSSSSSNQHQQQQQQQQHMLAVSFVDGTVYLMRNYDEIFPCVIETSLINIKMEWSNNGEILAVGGHRLTRSTGYHTGSYYMYQNILRFYSTNGQLIKQVTLDFNWQPLSALTWACNDRRVFIACGQLLYVAWIIHGIPSLSFFSGLQVYNKLRHPNEIKSLQVPGPVKQLLNELFTPTIHCYLPDYADIGQFVFRPPPNNRRLHCTLMRHEDISSRSNADSIYILYLEYLGSLVPILKGKRSSKIKPEFVIFDPQQQQPKRSSKHNSKCSKSLKPNHNCGGTPNKDDDCDNTYDIDNLTTDGDDQNSRRIRCLMANNCNPNNIGWIQLPSYLPPPPPPPQQLPPNENNLISNNNSDNENNTGRGDRSCRNGIFMGHPPFLTPKTRRRLRLTRNRNNNNNNNSNQNNNHAAGGNSSGAGPSVNQMREQQQQQQHQQQDVGNDVNDVDAIVMETSLGNDQPYHQQHHYAPWLDDLPEKTKIVLITSNIWGTKFKFLSMTSALPSSLGSVSYKTSLLHLQPRQMSLIIKELNENNTRLGNVVVEHCHSKTKLIQNSRKNDTMIDSRVAMIHHNHTAGCSTSNGNDQYDSNSYLFQNFTSDESEDDEYEQQYSYQQRKQQLQRIMMMKMNSDMDTDSEDIISLCNNGDENVIKYNSMGPAQQPAIVPMNSLKTIRNSMLLSLNDLSQQIQQQQQQQQQVVLAQIQQPPVVVPDLNAVGPSSSGNSNKNQNLPNMSTNSCLNTNNNTQSSLLSDEFLTLHIQQNDSGGSSYNLEIKPSPSSSAAATRMSTTLSDKIQKDNNNNESLLSLSLSLPPPTSPPVTPFQPMKTKRSNSNTMVRQFKHQTFQSESPKHVATYRQQQQQQQKMQQTTVTSPPTTPKQDQPSSPITNSPNKQGSKSKISTLKESPRRNSSSVSYIPTELFQKKTGYIDNDDSVNTDDNKIATTGIGTSKTTTCFEIASSIGNNAAASPTTTAAASATAATYQTYHIYDDTDLQIHYPINHCKPIDVNTNTATNIDASNQLVAPLQNDFDVDEDDPMATENYLKNVEQVVQSLSEKLQSKMILLQQTSLHQKNMQQNNNNNNNDMICNASNVSSLCCSDASSTTSLFRSDSLPYYRQKQKSKKYNHLNHLQQQQQQQSNGRLSTALSCSSLISTTSTTLTNTNSINQNHVSTQNLNKNNIENKINRNRQTNHSLPASPLMLHRHRSSERENNRRLSIDQQHIQSSTASNRIGEKEFRKSNGRHFFQSPKLVRKIRRKLSYLDCSSEDDNSDDDTDYTGGSIRTTVSDDNALTDSEMVYGGDNGGDLVSINDLDDNQQQQQRLNEKKKSFSNSLNLKKKKHRKHRKHYLNEDDTDDNNADDDDNSKRFQLHNKAPIWNEVSQVYQLDFGGRVTQESAKNFQIEHQGKQVMQFGRIDTNAYTLDFEYPFSAIQAMAVALANVTQRLK